MVFAHAYGGETAKWLTQVLGQSFDLVCFDTSFEARKLTNMKKNLQVLIDHKNKTNAKIILYILAKPKRFR